jgi:hypothetical protein
MRCVQLDSVRTLDHQGVDVDKADLQQVERQHGELLVLQVVGSDLAAFAGAIGLVPVLDYVETFLDFAPQRFGVWGVFSYELLTWQLLSNTE